MDTTGRKLCMICAWRRDCLKKYKYESSKGLKCLDFSRDVTIPAEDDADKEKST